MPVAAFPFVTVTVDLSAVAPVARRAPGVIAVVGKTPNGAAGGSAEANTPTVVANPADAGDLFARVANGAVQPTQLYSSLLLALNQDPAPEKVYGVRVAGSDYAAALASLEGIDDVRFVSLASEVDIGAAAGADPATNLQALKAHCDDLGLGRIGFAMVDPAAVKSPTYVNDVAAAVEPLRSGKSRMVMIAARGANGDAATAAMAAVAAYPPHISAVLKQVRGIQLPPASRFSPSEIVGLSDKDINPVIDPDLIPGPGLFLAEGRTFTSDEKRLYIDFVRTLDHVDFSLKAGLIGQLGDARITKTGMTRVKLRTREILAGLQAQQMIDDFAVDIAVLDALGIPESARGDADRELIQRSRGDRLVGMDVTIWYGPAVHRLAVNLAVKF